MCFTHEVLGWVKHISSEIPGYNNWKEIYDFTFDALNAPDAVPGSDETHIGTEADLVADFQNPELESEYALLDKETEKKDLADHIGSLRKARRRQDILDTIASRYSAANPMPTPLALRLHKIRYTYKLREYLWLTTPQTRLASSPGTTSFLSPMPTTSLDHSKCPFLGPIISSANLWKSSAWMRTVRSGMLSVRY